MTERADWAPRARVIEVIEVSYLRGKGIEKDPARQVIVYRDKGGNFLAERDRWRDDERTKIET
jgi:hypothetical protein